MGRGAESATRFLPFRSLGLYFGWSGRQDDAIAWFDKALQINPRDYCSFLEKGVSLSEKGEEDAAIHCFDKALEVNPRDWNALRQKGVSLSKKGLGDAAISCFDKALEVNPRDCHTLRLKGASLSEKGQEDAAIDYYDKALEISSQDSYALCLRSLSLTKKGEHDAAIDAYKKAVDANAKNASMYRSDFVYVCRAAGRNPEAVWQRIQPGTPFGPLSREEQLKDFGGFFFRLREDFGRQCDTFLKEKETYEAKHKDFLGPTSRLDAGCSIVMVLKKWNSFTPTLPSAEEERSRGGGYFLWNAGHGTVVDPGYNFIENFHDAGCRICDINNIVITHAHNDHTMDFESLCTLFHQYNAERGKDKTGPPKKVKLYLSNSVLLKFASQIDLRGGDYTDHVYTLNPGGEFDLGSGLSLRAVPAYHDDVLARDQSLGLSLRIGERWLLFTGDTGLWPLRKEGKDILQDASGEEIWQTYGIDKNTLRPDLMVIHIGSIKREEFTGNVYSCPKEACYPNHLGVIGTARVITQCLPRLAVVSEFGEEMGSFRMDLIRGLQDVVVRPFLETQGANTFPRVVPGDLPFIYDIKKDAFYCCVAETWVQIDDIDFDLDTNPPGSRESTVFYFAAKDRPVFQKHRATYAKRFRNAQSGYRGLYFREGAV